MGGCWVWGGGFVGVGRLDRCVYMYVNYVDVYYVDSCMRIAYYGVIITTAITTITTAILC